MKFDEWMLLAESKESFDRLQCIDEIPNLSNEKIVPVLLKFLEDENELVRTCAAEELVEYSDHYGEVIKSSLKTMLETDKSILACSYAIVSFCQLANGDDLIFVANYFESTSDPYLRLNVAAGLFLIAQKVLVDHFNDSIGDTNTPHIKGAAINLIKYLYESIYVTRVNVTDTLRKISQLSEEDIGIQETANAALKEIEYLHSKQ